MIIITMATCIKPQDPTAVAASAPVAAPVSRHSPPRQSSPPPPTSPPPHRHAPSALTVGY